ncbi:MAG: PEP-CTERM/exosortase system-associated acyltransferase [Stellaceae bacterium]
MGQGQDVWEHYNRHFSVVRANTAKLLDQVYRLRYQVYCVENSFEDSAEHLDGRETDAHDETAEHILLFHRNSGAAVGTTRVIMPSRVTGWRPLPIQLVLASGDRQAFDRLPVRQTAEVSRFAVSKKFRGEGYDQRLMRYITFGLMQGIVQTCIEYGITYIAAIMEPSLIRMLLRFGLEFEPIGEHVEYHGVRQPCVARLADLVEGTRPTPLWKFVSIRHTFSHGAPATPLLIS